MTKRTYFPSLLIDHLPIIPNTERAALSCPASLWSSGFNGGAKATTTLFCLGQCLEIHQANMMMVIEWFKYKTIYKEPRKYLCSGEYDTGQNCM